ncbi:MAG: hypothetical protein IJX46_02915 [Clostridia bacterium]|nr:hypothetical protein [Clostridia bacterium]
MYVYEPKPDRRGAHSLIILCLSAALMLLWPTDIDSFWRSVCIACGALALFCAFLLACRYLLTSYVYRVEERDGFGYDLTVEQIFVKRRRTLCRIAIEDIESLEAVEGKRKKNKRKKSAPKCVTYKYFSELFCRRYLIMELPEEDARVRVIITPDEKLTGILRELSGHM